MKNKKLAISVLSTAVLASMASTAFAKVDEGIYIGGNVKEYYSTLTFVDLPQTVRAGVLQKINNAGNDNVVYVNSQGKAASVSNIIDAGNLGDALRDPDENTFAEGDYAIIGTDGQPTGETKNPGSEVEPPVDVAEIVITNTADDAELTVGSENDSTLTLVAVAKDAEGNELDVDIDWESSNEEVATVEDGVVTAVGEGTATITAKAGDKEATFEVTVHGEEATLEVVNVSAIDNSDFTVSVSGTATGADAVKVSLDGGQSFTNATYNAETGEYSYKSSALRAGEYTVTVIAVKGEEQSEAKTASVTVDKAYATAINQQTVRVMFDQPVTAATVESLANYTLVKSGSASVINITDATAVNNNGVTVGVELTLGTNLVNGVEYILAANNIRYASDLSKFSVETKFTGVADEIAPSITSVVVNDLTTMEITFNENVNVPATAQFEIKDASGNVVTNGTIAGNDPDVSFAENVVTIDLNGQGVALTAGQSYVLVVNGVTDVIGNEIAADSEMNFTASADVTPPTVTSVAWDADTQGQLNVTFSEDVADGGSGEVAIIDPDTMEVIASDAGDITNNVVAVDFSAANIVEGKNYKVRVKGYHDVSQAQNPMATVLLDLVGADFVSPSLTGVTLLSTTQVELVFDEAVNISGATFTIGGAEASAEVSATDNKKVILTLDSDDALSDTSDQALGGGDTDASDVVLTGTIKDLKGNELSATDFADDAAGLTVTDKAAPVILSAVLTAADETVTLTFSEDLEASTVADYDEADEVATILTVEGVNGNTVEVTDFLSGQVGATNEVTFVLGVDAQVNDEFYITFSGSQEVIVDADGNVFKPAGIITVTAE